MPDGLITLVDAEAGGAPRTRIPVARLGKFSDSRYGRFAITAEMVASWQRNLAELFDGRVAIDMDHSSEKAVGRKTEAAAWITSLEIDGDTVYSDVEWTPLGEQAVRERRYLYISPTFVSDHKDEQGRGHGDALIGAGLTNRPFLRQGMPAISLAAEPVFAEADDDGNPEPSDSRRRMPGLTDIAKALGLDEDADEAKVLEAVNARPQPLADVAKELELADDADADKVLDTVKQLKAGGEEKSLEDRARAEGKVVLDENRVDALEAEASKGAEALKQLHQSKFDAAFAKALDEGRLDTLDETRERFQRLYDADDEATIATLEALPAVVPTRAKGSGKGAGETAPDGVDPDRHELDRKVRAYMTEKSEPDYLKALDAVTVIEVEGATA